MSAKPWIVLKFGGTSVASATNWKHILTITHTHLENGFRPLLVCSALSGVSNLLEKAFSLASQGQDFQAVYQKIRSEHQDLSQALKLAWPERLEQYLETLAQLLQHTQETQDLRPQTQAQIMAHGELMSSSLGQAWLTQQGLKLSWLDARELLHSEDETHLSQARHFLTAHCPHDYSASLNSQLTQQAPLGGITQGFIASDSQGATVLLGRGGSDTSAACLAARIGALELEIWTDVPGMYTANPRLIPQARLIRSLDYDEAEVMAYRGAKVLHPRSLAPVRDYNIPMRIRCTTAPWHSGTLITRQNLPQASGQVRAIASRSSLCLISAQKTDHTLETFDFLSAVAKAFCSRGVAISSLTSSSEQVSVILDSSLNAVEATCLDAVMTELKTFSRPRIQPQVGAISLTGHRIGETFQQISTVLEAANQSELRQLLHSSDNRDITLIVDCEDTGELVKSLHQSLIESQPDSELGLTWAEFKQQMQRRELHVQRPALKIAS